MYAVSQTCSYVNLTPTNEQVCLTDKHGVHFSSERRGERSNCISFKCKLITFGCFFFVLLTLFNLTHWFFSFLFSFLFHSDDTVTGLLQR